MPCANSVLLYVSENAPDSLGLGKVSCIGAYYNSTPLEKYVLRCTSTPMSVLPEPDVMGYDGGNATACHDQSAG